MPPLANDGRVILVTLDGVRASDAFGDSLPRTRALVEAHGVALGGGWCEHTVETGTGVNVSLPSYFAIFTGHQTGCLDNRCDALVTPTVLDEAAAQGMSAASIGSWEVLDHAVSNGTGGVTVLEGSTHFKGRFEDDGLEALVRGGEQIAPFPGDRKYRPDLLTMLIALRYYRLARPRVFHVGLGDADEWGHRNDLPAYLAAIRAEDEFIGELATLIDDKTTVIVTTDHGRNEDFRHHGAGSRTAARSWVMAFGARVTPRGATCSARDLTVADIAPTLRALVGLPPDGLPIEEIVR